MSKYFKQKWSQNFINFIGLPRPYLKVDYKYRFKGQSDLKDNFFLHPEVPVPWQSMPNINRRNAFFNVIDRNEEKVISEKRCPYCGNIFLDNEKCIRWTSPDKTPSKDSTRIFSDVSPLHIECMEQARIFCPHMRKTSDGEFEIDIYIILRDKFLKQINTSS